MPGPGQTLPSRVCQGRAVPVAPSGVCPSCHLPWPAVLHLPRAVAHACSTRRSLAHLVAQVVGDQCLFHGCNAPVHHVRGGHDVTAWTDGQDRTGMWGSTRGFGTPGNTTGGQGSTPSWSPAQFAFGSAQRHRGALGESQTGLSLPGAAHLLWHKPVPPLPAAGS